MICHLNKAVKRTIKRKIIDGRIRGICLAPSITLNLLEMIMGVNPDEDRLRSSKSRASARNHRQNWELQPPSNGTMPREIINGLIEETY